MQTLEEKRLKKNARSKAWHAAKRATSEGRTKANQASAAWSKRNAEAHSIGKAIWQTNNPGYAHQAYLLWKARNPTYKADRLQNNPLHRLRHNLGCLTYQCFKLRGWGKTTKTQGLLGCTFEEFIEHLQSKFKPGMTLENHGDWHIDHIKPCVLAANSEEIAALFHFTNLQPLWASENLSKGAKYDKIQ